MPDYSPFAPQLAYKSVCAKHGEVELIDRGRPFNIGRCPKCAEENPNVRFPYTIKDIPVTPTGARLKVEE